MFFKSTKKDVWPLWAAWPFVNTARVEVVRVPSLTQCLHALAWARSENACDDLLVSSQSLMDVCLNDNTQFRAVNAPVTVRASLQWGVCAVWDIWEHEWRDWEPSSKWMLPALASSSGSILLCCLSPMVPQFRSQTINNHWIREPPNLIITPCNSNAGLALRSPDLSSLTRTSLWQSDSIIQDEGARLLSGTIYMVLHGIPL